MKRLTRLNSVRWFVYFWLWDFLYLIDSPKSMEFNFDRFDGCSNSEARILALLYHFIQVYRLKPDTAAKILRTERNANLLCDQIINEIRDVLTDRIQVRFGSWCPEKVAKRYLSKLLVAYDEPNEAFTKKSLIQRLLNRIKLQKIQSGK